MNTRTFFIALGIGSLALAVGISMWLMDQKSQLVDAAIDAEIKDTGMYMQAQIQEHLQPQFFTMADGPERRKIFEDFFRKIQTPEIVRIKVWNAEHEVIWSEYSELIGEKFPDNHEVAEALEGETVLELEESKGVHVTERQYTYLAEIYLPVRDSSNGYAGVIEIYKPGTFIEARTKDAFREKIMYALIAFALGFAALTIALSSRRRK